LERNAGEVSRSLLAQTVSLVWGWKPDDKLADVTREFAEDPPTPERRTGSHGQKQCQRTAQG